MRHWPGRMMLVGGILAFLLATSLVSTLKASDAPGGDMLVQLLGGTADLVADKAYIQADVYFHKGVVRHEGECEDHGGPRWTPATAVSNRLPLMGWVRSLQETTSPTIERHVSGREESEVLPWFVVATQINPHHIDAWCTGTYWFFRTGDGLRAEEFATEGIRHNVTDYHIRLERGILYHRLARWTDSVHDLQAADRLCRGTDDDTNRERRTIRTFLKDALKHLHAK